MKKIFGIMIVVFVLILAGCSTKPVTNQKQENNDKLSVVASFYPLAYMAERIGGDAVEVKNIVGMAEPHEYMPGPSDITAIHNADLVILQGAGLEPWGDDVVAQLKAANKPVVEVASKLTLMKSSETAHGHKEDAHEEYNPHTWLDPVLAEQMVKVIADAMIKVDPDNADVFRANAVTLNQEFTALDKSYKEGLANCTRDKVIVSHDALGYLAKRYGFTTYPIAGVSTEDEPSAKVLAELKNVATEGITHILTEENAVKEFSQTLANETGLATLQFNPLETSSADGADFFDRARVNLVHLQTALGCK